jgi:hypothetical protein
MHCNRPDEGSRCYARFRWPCGSCPATTHMPQVLDMIREVQDSHNMLLSLTMQKKKTIALRNVKSSAVPKTTCSIGIVTSSKLLTVL